MCIDVLLKLKTKAVEWDSQPLAIAAIRSAASLYDEKLKNPGAAIKLLDDSESIGFRNISRLQDARAIILYHQKQYEEALSIIEPIIRDHKYMSSEMEYGPIYSCRLAGVCSGHLQDWETSADYFDMAHIKSASLGGEVLELGLLADQAYAEWMAEHYEKALLTFKTILHRLEKLEKLFDELAPFTLYKRFWQMMLSIRSTIS